MDGLCHGPSHLEMDWGVAPFMETAISVYNIPSLFPSVQSVSRHRYRPSDQRGRKLQTLGAGGGRVTWHPAIKGYPHGHGTPHQGLGETVF